MIFGRNRRRGERAEEVPQDEAVSDDDHDLPDVASPAEEQPVVAGAEDEPGLDLAALDATQWRDQGPFDVTELHEPEPDDPDGDPGAPEEAEDEAPRIDLGSMILTGVPGAELRLQVTEDTQEIISAMLILPDVEADDDITSDSAARSSSALELSAFAAPRSGGLWAELRTEIADSAIEAGGSASLGEGPFGVELRRLVPVTAPDGEQGYQPSRMWVAEGPRWMLRGIVYGSAAIEEDSDAPNVAAVVEAFRSVVVQRGDEAMAPGDLLPFTMPGDLTPAP